MGTFNEYSIRLEYSKTKHQNGIEETNIYVNRDSDMNISIGHSCQAHRIQIIINLLAFAMRTWQM